ncbi:MBL fold metallo-hydrolase [Nocardioides jiangxiensis]|uniref:MBL fold metallo-hydrolase n=1 Tax=Nocardioides jiangxiensis TaxID=3064524 RepID=A0ABT9B3W9_9ACTN|nr:MBL fold metallo-hydrolase [Nocardioides sp. WY-20]MDO7869531.1 MBL fold metallo-hydrolase [Nocardioides sp. WY-20]
MTYTGDVTPAGPPAIRELPGLTITKYAVDPRMANNCYLLRCTATGAQLLVDAADDAPALLELTGGIVDTIVTTHQHWDHHRALADLAAVTRPMTVAGAPDADAIESATGVPVSRRVGDGDVVRVGDVELEVIAIAGHTPGSICLLYRDPAGHPHLWTGDALFPGGVGATFGDADAFATLIDQVETKIFDRLPDETWFYPGHGGDSTLGTERPSLPDWRARGW